MRLSDDTLRGRTVIASDGLELGQIDAMFVDCGNWRVESLQVKLHKDVADRLGADRGVFHAGTLEVPTGMVQSVGDAVILAVALDDLRRVVPTTADAAAANQPG